MITNWENIFDRIKKKIQLQQVMFILHSEYTLNFKRSSKEIFHFLLLILITIILEKIELCRF